MFTVSMSEMKNLLNHAIDNNFRLQDEGKRPIAVGIEGDAGLGKTSLVEEIAKDRGMGFTKLVLSQLEESGDLCGYPQIEYECQVAKKVKGEDGTVRLQILPGTVWLNAKQLDGMEKGTFRQTGRTHMGYAKPAWVPEYNENGTILLLDDYSRANQTLLQSVMEIIATQGYVSWKLPKKTTVVLTSNPDNGSYNVQTQDEAQVGRYVGYSIVFDENSWAQWAEEYGVDGRCINFVLSYSNELFGSDEEGNHICNPRSFVMFSDMISGIKDWDNPDNLAFITTISRGCFKDERGRFSTMFSSFIRNKMHLLIQPKDMLLGGWDRIKGILEQTVYDTDGHYRSDIASLLERRFTNYGSAWLNSDGKTPIDTVKKRILDFLDYEQITGKRIFGKDMFYHMIKNITSTHKNQTNKLLFEPKIAKILS